MTEPVSPRQRLLEAAERLFAEHGYAAVKLRDVANAAGLHHSSLYHHAPGGKAELFAEAMELGLDRHSRELRARVDAHRGDLRSQLLAAATWLVEHPAGNHSRMLTTDLPNLPEEVGSALAAKAWRGVVGPVTDALEEARQRGDAALGADDVWMVAGALVSALQALHTAHSAFPGGASLREQAQRLVDVFLRGVEPR